MMLGYKCEPLEGLDHGAFIQRVFIEVLLCAGWVLVLGMQRGVNRGRHRRPSDRPPSGALGGPGHRLGGGSQRRLREEALLASDVQGRTGPHALWAANSR